MINQPTTAPGGIYAFYFAWHEPAIWRTAHRSNFARPCTFRQRHGINYRNACNPEDSEPAMAEVYAADLMDMSHAHIDAAIICTKESDERLKKNKPCWDGIGDLIDIRYRARVFNHFDVNRFPYIVSPPRWKDTRWGTKEFNLHEDKAYNRAADDTAELLINFNQEIKKLELAYHMMSNGKPIYYIGNAWEVPVASPAGFWADVLSRTEKHAPMELWGCPFRWLPDGGMEPDPYQHANPFGCLAWYSQITPAMHEARTVQAGSAPTHISSRSFYFAAEKNIQAALQFAKENHCIPMAPGFDKTQWAYATRNPGLWLVLDEDREAIKYDCQEITTNNPIYRVSVCWNEPFEGEAVNDPSDWPWVHQLKTRLVWHP